MKARKKLYIPCMAQALETVKKARTLTKNPGNEGRITRFQCLDGVERKR